MFRRKMILLAMTVIIIVGWFFATLASGNSPELGLDLQGGLSVVLFPLKGSDVSTLDTAVQIIRNRVDGLGIAEPDVSRQGDTIVVDLPGVKDRQKALDTVGRTAELRFRQVVNILPWGNAPPSASSTTTTVKGAPATTTPTTAKPAATGTTKGKAEGRPTRIDAQTIAAVRPEAGSPSTSAAPGPSTTAKGTTPTTTAPQQQTVSSCQDGKLVTPDAQDTTDAPTVILPDKPDKHGRHQYCYVMSKTIMTGKNVGTARAEIGQTGGWQVALQFKNDDFANKIGQPLAGQPVAIVLDHIVYSAPTIDKGGITGRDVQITGNFSHSEASNLALVLKYGSLPVQFDSSQQTVQDVSPTLGKDQLHAGIVAGLIGLALVMLYMIFFYRLLGLVVWIGLALTGMTFYSLTTFLSVQQGLTLTLAGVTGIIVSVGVTVDSYVVYFERLKDEVRTGKTVRSSLDAGFRRAFRTIIAADLVSLIGAAVLYVLAAGSVKGFAYFLGLSTALDLILAYCFMHPFVMLLARRPELVRMRGIGIAAGLDVQGVRA